MIKAYCYENGFKLERFKDFKHLDNEDVPKDTRTIGSRYYPEDLSNLIDFIRKNCTPDGIENKICKKAAPSFSSFC
jgi:hypothetical protein